MAEPRGMWTVMEVLRWTAGRFGAAGLDSPRLDAELLLAGALGLRRIDLYTQHDRPLERTELEGFKDLVRRRLAREPVAYLVGRREFWKRSFRVDRRVMCPRPETELLVDAALAAAPADRELLVVDVCTGSGNVVISILEERPAWRGIGVDLSPEALEVAAANRDDAGLAGRLELRRGDLLEGLRERPGLLTANPPYVADGDWETLAPEIRGHEPRRALTSGPDGLDHLRRLLPGAAALLAEGGRLLVEFGGGPQTPALRDLAAAAGLTDVRVLPDLHGIDRILSARRREAGAAPADRPE